MHIVHMANFVHMLPIALHIVHIAPTQDCNQHNIHCRDGRGGPSFQAVLVETDPFLVFQVNLAIAAIEGYFSAHSIVR